MPDDDLLYHYTGPGKLALIASSGGLRSSSLGNMSDPRESRLWRPSFVLDDNVELASDEWERWLNELDRELRLRAKIACFTRDRFPVEFSATQFHRGYARARMWDQYAAKHTGTCLIFDKAKLEAAATSTFARVGQVYTGRVTYVDRRIGDANGLLEFHSSDLRRRGVVSTAERYLEAHWPDLLMTKNLDWASEEEHRVVLVERADGESDRFIPIADALISIVIGELCSDYERDQARLLLIELGLDPGRLVRCVWFGGAPHALPAQ